MMETLAHGSGIDDAIIVLLPLVLVIVILRFGARKAPPEEGAADPADAADPAEPAAGGPDDPR